MPTFAEIKAASALPERSVAICLRGDLLAEFERLERDLAAEQNRATDSLDGGGRVAEYAERLDALHQQMRESTLEFRLRAMPRKQWRALLAEHPIRRGADDAPDEGDVYVGVNRETFPPSLIAASVIDPVFTADEWRELLDDMLTDKQYDDLHQAAWDLNRTRVKIPFSQAASQLIRSTAAE